MEEPHHAVCHHCGLPVTGHQTKENRDQTFLFCCFGCRMVWEVEAHQEKHTEQTDSPVGLSPMKRLYLRFALALIASMFLIFISLTLHFEGDRAPDFLAFFSLILATGVMILLSGPFWDNLKRELTDRRLSLATLIFTGSGAAYLLSAWNTLARIPALNETGWFMAGEPTYFETSAMILTFYVGSLLLDARIKQGMASYSRLWHVDRAPDVIRISEENYEAAKQGMHGRFTKNGQKTFQKGEKIEADRLVEGDYLLLEQSEPAFVDGEIVFGEGLVDESHLTGEPNAVKKSSGDTISAGSISIDGGLIVKVIRPYQESSMSSYIKKARAMRSRPGYYERFAARAAQLLLIFVVGAAITGFTFHLLLNGVSEAIPVFLSVLLIGCPCAFSISTPAALWVANHRLHRAGIVAMGGSRALEKLSAIKAVLFDKTGTLTEGVAIESIKVERNSSDIEVEALMRMAGGLEMSQEHPFARAVRRYLDQHGLDPHWPLVSELLPGKGMKGTFSPKERQEIDVLLVNHTHVSSRNVLQDGEIGLFVNDTLMLRFRLFQPPREHLEAVITALRDENNVHVAVVTGDPADAAAVLPSMAMPTEAYHSGCSPQKKAELVEKYRKNYGEVMFVGDGTNDLMAITSADLGVGVYTGTLTIRNHADFVLFHPHLGVINELLTFGKRIRKTILINFFWAVAYNVIGIGVALAGWLHPFFAILAMMLSSIFVTLHSASLTKQQPSLEKRESEVNLIRGKALLHTGIKDI